ncbi:MAG: glycine--tRNA ligase subunit beta [Dictyoglomus sp.]|nr:glycine--tRNA ligase subunit beta [Dictyoglomus sp.]MCX7941668.1 glycine--tRNA ligase subunit beta [Dictyoglomaceae bacterium]MDW8188180.1 glycine--tRNA ligase subunit beta [Dictyoglomus sp.]
MGKDLLVEIGTEEMPASFLRPALLQMEEITKEVLDSNFLFYKDIKVYATPRRLVVYVEDLDEYQRSQEEEIRGPAEKIAYKDGQWLEPAIKFSQQYGVKLEDLFIKNTEKGSYVFLKRKIQGKLTKDLLPNIIKEIITTIKFPKMMRWGDVDFVFGRPIKWLLILYGEESIDLEIARIKSSNFSCAPRFLSEKKLQIKSSQEYFYTMKENYILLDQEERKNEILRQAENLAMERGFYLDYSPELLEELTFLVEYPTAFLGEFDKRYLNLPEIVLKVTMEKKQRYFPLRDNKGKLVNYFIGIRNGTEKNIDIIREGNEKVLKARLSDAEYYYNEDKKEPLQNYLKKLDGIIFHEKLGSMRDKVERVKKIIFLLEQDFNLEDERKIILERAVELYKADLGTLMVSEYPELHGVIGEIYAKNSGEDEEVAKILGEYFLPKTLEDNVSSNLLSNILGIADRIDSLTGYFSLELFPTGSEDPIGLRRLTNGLLKILWEKEYDIKIKDLFDYSWNIYGFKNNKDNIWKKAEDFLSQRLRNFLIEKNYPIDLINGVLSLGFDPIWKVKKRLETLVELQKDNELYSKLYTSANRLVRIIPSNFVPLESLKEEYLITDEEKKLYYKFLNIKDKYAEDLKEGNYLKIFKSEEILDLVENINVFFDKVLVMSPKKEERDNRLSLISYLKNLFWELVDWSKIVKV